MPSVTPRQHAFFEYVFRTPGAVKKTGVPKSVAREFLQADAGRKSLNYKGARVKKQKQAMGFKKNVQRETD